MNRIASGSIVGIAAGVRGLAPVERAGLAQTVV